VDSPGSAYGQIATTETELAWRGNSRERRMSIARILMKLTVVFPRSMLLASIGQLRQLALAKLQSFHATL
jgi:hypothetical protein